MARIWTLVGITLCILILIYLSIVARRAVDDELDDGPVTARDNEETWAFLSADNDPESAHLPLDGGPMTEVPFRSQQMPLSSVRVDPNRTWSWGSSFRLSPLSFRSSTPSSVHLCNRHPFPFLPLLATFTYSTFSLYNQSINRPSDYPFFFSFRYQLSTTHPYLSFHFLFCAAPLPLPPPDPIWSLFSPRSPLRQDICFPSAHR